MTGTNLTLTNLHAHAWHLTSACVDGSDNLQGGFQLVSANDTKGNNVLSNSTVDGSDATDAKGRAQIGGAYVGNVAAIYGNTFHDLPNAVFASYGTFHDNAIYNINQSCDTNQHSRALAVSSNTETTIIYNNVIHDNRGPISVCGNLHFYNNVLWVQAGGLQINTNCGNDSSANAYVYNNTIDGGTGGVGQVVNWGKILASLTLENNHYITDASGNPFCYGTSNGCSAVGSVTDGYGSANTVIMTQATATGDGYTSSQTSPFSPTAANNPTVGVALNLISSCSTLTALCSDRLGTTRKLGGTWNAGAYEYPNPPLNAPNAPTTLIVIVQ